MSKIRPSTSLVLAISAVVIVGVFLRYQAEADNATNALKLVKKFPFESDRVLDEHRDGVTDPDALARLRIPLLSALYPGTTDLAHVEINKCVPLGGEAYVVSTTTVDKFEIYVIWRADSGEKMVASVYQEYQ